MAPAHLTLPFFGLFLFMFLFFCLFSLFFFTLGGGGLFWKFWVEVGGLKKPHFPSFAFFLVVFVWGLVLQEILLFQRDFCFFWVGVLFHLSARKRDTNFHCFSFRFLAYSTLLLVHCFQHACPNIVPFNPSFDGFFSSVPFSNNFSVMPLKN